MADVVSMAVGLSQTVPMYWQDSYLSSHSSRVVRAVHDEKRYWYVVLDATIFHPKGGGQPSDRGLLEGQSFKMEVRKAMLAGKGVIVHWGKITEGTPHQGPVGAKIDWEWRFLMMRRHSAAHLLDHSLEQVIGATAEALDSWLGDPCYVAYGGQPPSDEQLREIEMAENRTISRGATVTAREVGAEELKREITVSLDLGRLPNPERVRLVTIEGCRPIACGGTHLRNVSEAKGIRLGKIETVAEGFQLHYDVV